MKTKSLLILTLVSVLFANLIQAQIDSDYYGLFAENSGVAESIEIVESGEEGGHIYIWNGFTAISDEPFSGDTALILQRDADTWNGIGIQSDNPVDLSYFYDGYIKLALKTTTTDKDFRFGIKDQDENGWVVWFKVDADPYDFARDGEWYDLAIPIKDFQPEDENTPKLTAENLSNMTVLLFLVGTIDVGLDEIYYSMDAEGPGETSSISNLSNNIKIYPNPSSNMVSISGINQAAQVSIISTDGRLIENITTNAKTQIDLSSYTPGMYLVQISNSEGSITKPLIIK